MIPIVVLFDHSTKTAIFAGIALAASSVSISAQTLLELGVLQSKVGFGLLATAVVDDVLAIFLLSIAVAVFGSDGSVSVIELAWIFIRMALYIGGALLLSWTVLPRALNGLHRNSQLAASVTAFALFAALIFGWAAEELGGIAAITGAFIAGIGVGQTNERTRKDIITAVRTISYSFLVPIFFVSVALETDLSEFKADMLPLALLILIAAVGSKIIGAGLGARLGGFSEAELLPAVGLYDIARGSQPDHHVAGTYAGPVERRLIPDALPGDSAHDGHHPAAGPPGLSRAKRQRERFFDRYLSLKRA